MRTSGFAKAAVIVNDLHVNQIVDTLFYVNGAQCTRQAEVVVIITKYFRDFYSKFIMNCCLP